MAHEETIYGLMEELVIADKHIVGDIMSSRGIWTEGTSASNNADKVLKNDYRLEKIDGYYRLIGCHSTYAEHSKLLTKYLADILKLNFTPKIFREKTLNEIGLRPDALVLLIKANQKLCFILEVCNNETPEYLLQKIHTWQNWPEAKDKLSELFNTQIKSYDFVVSGDDIPDEAFEFQAYMEELKK